MSRAGSKAQGSGIDRYKETAGKLAAGIATLASSEQWEKYLKLQARFRTYSFGNTMLILQQCPAATRVMGFGKKDGTTGWKSLGRHVRAGEHAIWIWAPTYRKISAEDSEDGQEHRRPGFCPVPVYDISQTEGEPLPEPAPQAIGEDPGDVLGTAASLIRSHGFTVEFTETCPGGAEGDTSYRDRRIRIATGGYSPLQQAKTILHEIAHMLLHRDSELPRGLKELEAESVAYIVAEHIGLNADGYSFAYVLGWSQGSPKLAQERIKASGDRIQKASEQILDFFLAEQQEIAA